MPGIVTRLAWTGGLILLGFAMALAGGWGVLALAYSGPSTETVRTALAAAFAVATLVAALALLFRRWRGYYSGPRCQDSSLRCALS